MLLLQSDGADPPTETSHITLQLPEADLGFHFGRKPRRRRSTQLQPFQSNHPVLQTPDLDRRGDAVTAQSDESDTGEKRLLDLHGRSDLVKSSDVQSPDGSTSKVRPGWLNPRAHRFDGLFS